MLLDIIHTGAHVSFFCHFKRLTFALHYSIVWHRLHMTDQLYSTNRSHRSYLIALALYTLNAYWFFFKVSWHHMVIFASAYVCVDCISSLVYCVSFRVSLACCGQRDQKASLIRSRGSPLAPYVGASADFWVFTCVHTLIDGDTSCIVTWHLWLE